MYPEISATTVISEIKQMKVTDRRVSMFEHKSVIM